MTAPIYPVEVRDGRAACPVCELETRVTPTLRPGCSHALAAIHSREQITVEFIGDDKCD